MNLSDSKINSEKDFVIFRAPKVKNKRTVSNALKKSASQKKKQLLSSFFNIE